MDNDEIEALLTDYSQERGTSLLAPPAVVYDRDLTPSDLANLSELAPPAITHSPLQVLRYRHHSAARMLAQGYNATQAALLAGYSPDYVAGLARSDPAFGELVEHYKRDEATLDAIVQSKLAALGMGCAEELQDRLDDPSRSCEIGVSTLAEVMIKALDRSVAPAKRAATPAGDLVASSGDGRLVVNLNFAEPPKRGITIDQANIEVLEEGDAP